MSLYDWLLALHVLSAFALVAALVVFTLLIMMVRNREVPSEVARLFRLSRIGDLLVNIGGIGVLVFGVWLAIEVDGYEIWDGWILAALVMWALFAEAGRRLGKHYYGARDRARALVAEGNDSPSPALTTTLRSNTGVALHLASVALALLLLLDMIYKPGA